MLLADAKLGEMSLSRDGLSSLSLSLLLSRSLSFSLSLKESTWRSEDTEKLQFICHFDRVHMLSVCVTVNSSTHTRESSGSSTQIRRLNLIVPFEY